MHYLNISATIHKASLSPGSVLEFIAKGCMSRPSQKVIISIAYEKPCCHFSDSSQQLIYFHHHLAFCPHYFRIRHTR